MTQITTEAAIRRALDGNAVLFVGSGFSRTAVNVSGENLKTGKELARLLAAEAGIDDDAPLDDAAEIYVEDRSAEALVELLRREFQVKELAPEHHVFGRVPWRRVYTTNYDDTIELAHRAAGRAIVSLSPADSVDRVASNQAQCVHINGFIGTLTSADLFNNFKLTDTSYSSASFQKSPWSQQFRHDLTVAKAVVFVGYSAYDLDIKRILLEKTALRAKTLFFVGTAPEVLTQRRLSKFGAVADGDTASLARMITAESSDYKPADPLPPIGRVVVERTNPESAREPQDRDISDLFLWGKTQFDLVWTAVNESGSARYVCPRSQLEDTLQLLENGHKNIVVRADLGNGKSVFLDSLDCQARNFGFRVLRIGTVADDFEEEVEAAARAEEKTLLLVDSYTNKRAMLEIIARNRSPELYLVCAARSIRHDVCFRWLHEVLGQDEIPEVDVEVLSPQELTWFREAMDEYGLWGRHAAWSPERKERMLRVECRSRISSILLKILESPAIADRLSEVVRLLSRKKEHAETAAGVLMLSVLDYAPSLDLVADLLGTEVLNQADFQRNEAVRELIEFSFDRVVVRSTVIAQHVLKNSVDQNVCLAAIQQLARRADELRGKRLFHEISKDFMRSANVQRILPDSPGLFIRYYEFCRTLEGSRRNPNFWLQYAIANMALRQYPEAKIKLETAYSLGGSGYDTFMLDTAHARWLLEEACENPKEDRETAISVFRKARGFIHSLISDAEERYYPFRVASKFKDFFSQHESCLSTADREEIAKAAKFVLTRISRLPAERRGQRYVRRCQDELGALLELSGHADEEKDS